MMILHQYEIVIAPLDVMPEGGGAVIKKTRPCVVLSPDEINRYLKTVVLAPLTTTAKTYPTRVKVRHKNKTGYVVLDQIVTLDKGILKAKVGKLSTHEVLRLKKVLQQTYVD
jgi:mRNA interferase MazF